jgi:hypothetical protein
MRSVLYLVLIYPAVLFANTQFILVSPTDGSSITVTANQSVPVLMTLLPTDGKQYTTEANVAPTCPTEASPCSNYVTSTGPVPPFVLSTYYSNQFNVTVTTILFKNAPAGFYAIQVSLVITGCPTAVTAGCPTTGNCSDNFIGTFQFTARVVSEVGAPANALPHFAVGGKFVTDLYAINNSAQPARFTVSFYRDSGSPASLPFVGMGSISTLTGTVPGFGTSFYEASDPNAPVQGGWALIQADPAITIQELFRNHGGNGSYYEAAVPAYPGSSGFRLPFDATTFTPTGDPLYVGFAVANLDAMNPARVTCTAFDVNGNVIPNAITIPQLNPLGHWANYLFPALTGARGTLDCSSNTTVAAIGLRFIGTNAFSSLPIVTK